MPVWRRKLLAGACALALAALLVPAAPMPEAQALECANSGTGGPQGNDGGHTRNTACGQGSDASGSSMGNSAFGDSADASGDGSHNTAVGFEASAFGDDSSNSAFGDGANASGDGTTNMAIGFQARASNNSIAIGANATATHDNAAAFGNGATTTRANQMALGTGSTTYTAAGITSAASKAAQGAPTHIVTSNASGDLAAYTFSELGLATQTDIKGLSEGIAAVAALAQPVLLPGQRFAMRAGWGGYDGENAIGLSAAGLLASDVLRPGYGTLTLDGGVGFGTGEGEVVGRAGVSFGW